MYIYIHICMYFFMYIYIYQHIHVCIYYTCLYIYIYMNMLCNGQKLEYLSILGHGHQSVNRGFIYIYIHQLCVDSMGFSWHAVDYHNPVGYYGYMTHF